MGRKRNRNKRKERDSDKSNYGQSFNNTTLKRSSRRTHPLSYIEKLKKGERTLSNDRDAQHFFNMLSRDYNDEKKLALNFDEDMENILKEATELLSPDLSEALKLLSAMGKEALTMGVYKERTMNCFRTLYHSTDFISTLSQKLKSGRLVGSTDHSTIAWFILQLGKSGDEEVLNDPILKELILFFRSSNQIGFPKLSEQLDVVFQFVSQEQTIQGSSQFQQHEKNVVSLEAAQQIMRPPGVRGHDNDKENFRSISIIPTTSELQCQEGAYLPYWGSSNNMQNEEAAALDRQFRLMREDLLGTVKEELQTEFTISASQRRRLLGDPCIVGFGMQPEPHVVVRVSLPPRIKKRIQAMDNKTAQEFFDNGPGKRVLQKGTLVLLVHAEDDETNLKKKRKINDISIFAVGTIVERKNPMQIVPVSRAKSNKKKRVLEVGISFTPESMRAISPLLQKLESKHIGVPMIESSNGGLFNASAGLFSLEPILKALVRMDQVPLGNQLVYLNKPQTPTLGHGGKLFSDLDLSLQKKVNNDQSQKCAMEQIFKSNTVLVQGPPGTGKTYIGVQMVKAMLQFEKKSPNSDRSLRILCLCYTNHALDSFLLDLIEAGIPSHLFIRLGSSPKINAKIKDRCLGEVNNSINTDFGRQERASYAAIKNESEQLEPRFNEVFNDITKNAIWGKSVSWWEKISEWMEEHYHEEHDQLRILSFMDDDGFVRTGKKGKSLRKNYLWERWFTGQDQGIFRDKEMIPTDIWKLEKSERKELISKWNQEWIQPQLDLLESTMLSLQKNTEALRTLRRENDLKVLSNITIIGCTTVAAAKYQGMINPNVVIVEEAGEILESHILANIGNSCEQLIMIGDHKQLRPKIDNYRLQKESGNGFDLNISLFERLIIAPSSNIPVIQLNVQHRMRPEISRLIRGMSLYESLEDHENTLGRNHVSGVVNDVVFFDHRQPEQLDETSAALGMETKVNPYEAEMVVSIAKYIIQQGQYSSDQVAILTPYLGQLSLIRKKLSEVEIDSYLSDQDMSDLARQDLASAPGGRGSEQNIRIATVDNFQGEESHVIIISLVRSCPRDGRIGFLASEERINVLLSRAREGMFIVGNLKSLSECASKPGRLLWSNLKSVLEYHNHCYEWFPTICQTHGTLQKIRSAQDFITHVPDGGCAVRCNATLDCGHQCPKKCHINAKHVHARVKCKEKVEDVCSHGHKQLRECYSTVKCMKMHNWFCLRGHTISGRCHAGRPSRCGTCITLEKLEKEAEEKANEFENQILDHQNKLIQTKIKLAAKMKEKENMSKLKMIKIEQALLEKEILDSKKALTTDSDLSNSDHHEVFEIETKQIDFVKNNDELKSKSADGSTFDCEKSNDFLTAQKICSFINDQSSSISSTASVSSHSQKEESGVFNSSFGVEDSSFVTCQQSTDGKVKSGKNKTGKSKVDIKNQLNSQVVDPNKQSSEINNANEDEKSSFGTCEQRIIEKAKSGKNKKEKLIAVNAPRFVELNTLLSNSDFCDAAKKFRAKEFLEADDLIENCLDLHLPAAERQTLEAFRYIIHDSLDPSGEKWGEDAAPKIIKIQTLNEAIQCWASFLSLSSGNEFPLISKKLAENFNTYSSPIGLVEDLLEIGRQRAKIVIKEAQNLINSSAKSKTTDETELKTIQNEWNNICNIDPETPAVVNDEVMKLTGLKEIKGALIDQYNRIRISQRQGDNAAFSYNVRFEGNPGTGKTTIARHYSTFLKQLSVLPEESLLFDITAASLKNKGISHLEEVLGKVKAVGGGVIFIDEAYQLKLDKIGEGIVDFILPISESLDGPYGKLVWILAGYQKEMEKLFEHNIGLPSRFPQRFIFKDYNAIEMQSIFEGLMTYKDKKPSIQIQEKKKKKLLTFSSSNNNRKTAYNSSHGERYDDRFGNTWTCDSVKGLWLDKYGNSTGYHPKDIGSTGNPLASRDGQLWENTNGLWISTNDDRQKHYPGAPDPSQKLSGKKELRDPPFKCSDEKFIRIAMRRLERQSNRPGFGNARTVRTFFDKVRERQSKRIAVEYRKGRRVDDFLFTKNDLLGANKDEKELKKSAAYLKLQKMEGLKPVKEQIDLLIELGTNNLKREECEKPLLEVMLNRVFLGNPGTGKTTVAKIYGELLTEMGLLSKGEVIIKNPSDFKGSVLGDSEKNTRDILRAAEGNVLVIDEAYALNSNKNMQGSSDIYSTAVIDTLVEQIQARPGDDRAVIMLGYRKEMEEMFKNVNPGLSRRFQLEHAYEFPDYNDAALLKILRMKASESKLNISIPVAKLAVRSLARARAKPNFGNAGAIDSILSKAKLRMQQRDGTSNRLSKEDFDVENVSLDEVALDNLFADMIGMDSVIKKLEDLKSIVKFAKSRGENPAQSVSFNYLFLGNPGTGKTTIARCMGKMFKILGLLPDDEVFEHTPKDFLTGFVGQAGKKTLDILEKSRGGVLFIDEAYQLNPQRGGSFMTEVVDELCAKLTDVEFKGKILVLLAGYDSDMDEMLSVNPGLKSRFTERLAFEDLSVEATRDLINLKLSKKNISLSPTDAKSKALLCLAQKLVESHDFANGRDVDTICDRTYAELAKRSSHRDSTATIVDVGRAIDSLITSRKLQENGKVCSKMNYTDQCEAKVSNPSKSISTGHNLAEKMKSDDEELENENDIAEKADNNTNMNPFDDLNTGYTKCLQDVVEEMGLNTKEGIKLLLSSNDNKQIIEKLMERLQISENAAQNYLKDWRKAHKTLDSLREQMDTKSNGMEAIWHCAVCGRGGRPQPVCYVAPYISGYKPI